MWNIYFIYILKIINHFFNQENILSYILILIIFIALEVPSEKLEPASSDPSRLHGLPHLRPGCISSGTLPAQTWKVRINTATKTKLKTINSSVEVQCVSYIKPCIRP